MVGIELALSMYTVHAHYSQGHRAALHCLVVVVAFGWWLFPRTRGFVGKVRRTILRRIIRRLRFLFRFFFFFLSGHQLARTNFTL